MRALSVAAVLYSTVGLSAEPTRVAVAQLQGVNVSSETLSFYAEHLASSLRAPGLNVITAREISTLLGLERQKQLLGCGEASTSCIAELANALGVDAIVVGDVARFEKTSQINVKVLNAADARVLSSRSARVDGDLATLDALAAMGGQLARGLLEAKGRPVPAELLARTGAAEGPSLRTLALIPLGVGVAAGALGGVMFGLSHSDYARLTGPGAPLTASEAGQLRDAGASKQTGGAILIAVGATSLAAAGAMFLFGAPRSQVVAVTPISQGAVLTLSGELP